MKTDKERKEITRSLVESISAVTNPQQDDTNEEYVEAMNVSEIDTCLNKIYSFYMQWKNGPETERSDIAKGRAELKSHIDTWFKKNIR